MIVLFYAICFSPILYKNKKLYLTYAKILYSLGAMSSIKLKEMFVIFNGNVAFALSIIAFFKYDLKEFDNWIGTTWLLGHAFFFSETEV